MSTKVDKALKRLNGILPLKKRQGQCSKPIKALHQQILQSFVSEGRILTLKEMAQQVSDIDEAVTVLKNYDMVTFSANGDPVGAYPFTTEAREHKIVVNGYLVHAMCALDALAVSPMFGMETKITSQCRVTGDVVNISQSGTAITNPETAGDIYFGIAWGAADTGSSCSDSLCMEMIFLKDSEVADQWLADDTENRETFSLQEAVEFAQRFFVPLVSR